LGRVSDSNGGYTLPDSSMRAPDVAWISNERLATISASELKKFAHVCPDFVIELMSESDELEDLQAKMKKWIENGVRLAWLIDPKKRETRVFFETKETKMVKFKEILSGYDVLPGWELILEEII
jgi:Uma2 family endonuclease